MTAEDIEIAATWPGEAGAFVSDSNRRPIPRMDGMALTQSTIGPSITPMLQVALIALRKPGLLLPYAGKGKRREKEPEERASTGVGCYEACQPHAPSMI